MKSGRVFISPFVLKWLRIRIFLWVQHNLRCPRQCVPA